MDIDVALEEHRRGDLAHGQFVSILLVVDVALEDEYDHDPTDPIHVSILLVVDVALEARSHFPEMSLPRSFNPSCSVCGS